MAVYSGKSGTVSFGGAVSNILSWTLEMSVDEQAAHSMGDTVAFVLPDFKRWTATVECRADDGGSSPAITSVGATNTTLTLGTGGGKDYEIASGAMLVSSGHSQDTDGTPTVTYTFSNSADVAVAEGAEA